MISILVPCLARPYNAQPLCDSIDANTETQHEIVFLCSPGDTREIGACRLTGAKVMVCPFSHGPGDFSRKINYGFNQTRSAWILMGADDLRFHRGWDTTALRVAEKTGAGVIGTDDLGNPEVTRKRSFSTHPLIRRTYIRNEGGSLEGPGIVLSEEYAHNFCDRELWDLAAKRGQAVFARGAIVEHLHPHWRKSKMDAVYRIGQESFRRDQKLWKERSMRIRDEVI